MARYPDRFAIDPASLVSPARSKTHWRKRVAKVHFRKTNRLFHDSKLEAFMFPPLVLKRSTATVTKRILATLSPPSFVAAMNGNPTPSILPPTLCAVVSIDKLLFFSSMPRPCPSNVFLRSAPSDFPRSFPTIPTDKSVVDVRAHAKTISTGVSRLVLGKLVEESAGCERLGNLGF